MDAYDLEEEPETVELKSLLAHPGISTSSALDNNPSLEMAQACAKSEGAKPGSTPVPWLQMLFICIWRASDVRNRHPLVARLIAHDMSSATLLWSRLALHQHNACRRHWCLGRGGPKYELPSSSIADKLSSDPCWSLLGLSPDSDCSWPLRGRLHLCEA